MSRLRTFGATLAASVALLLPATGQPATAGDSVSIAKSAVDLGDFELIDQNGKEFRFGGLRGKPVLVFFGFTHCPSVCPEAMSELRLLTQSLRKNGDPVPHVVLISVDGERDTPDVMRAFLEPVSKDFIGLTGDPRLVRDIAARFKAVFFKGIPGDNSGNYDVQHTSQIYLVDGAGILRARFVSAPIEQMAETIRNMAGAPGKSS